MPRKLKKKKKPAVAKKTPGMQPLKVGERTCKVYSYVPESIFELASIKVGSNPGGISKYLRSLIEKDLRHGKKSAA